MTKNFNARSVNIHQFSMTPRADIPRSRFKIESAHKTTFDAGYLVPIYVDEILPGDTFSIDMTAFCRMSTPLFPIMDNLYLDTQWFFVPNRLVWDNWQKFQGERIDPGDSIDYLVPQVVSPVGGYSQGTIYDYLGLPTNGGQHSSSGTTSVNAMFLRAYNLIYNEWYRDENLQDSMPVHRGDGPDPHTDYGLKLRGKRHDYFTSALPWPQKGDSVRLPLGLTAPVVSNNQAIYLSPTSNMSAPHIMHVVDAGGTYALQASGLPAAGQPVGFHGMQTGLYTDLSEATAATINQIRQSFQVQKLLERDARGGTRYTEILQSHFGVNSPDARLQRPEYLGGSSTRINITPIAQTSGTPSSGDESPLATLSGIGTAVSNARVTQSFTEHGMIIGIASVRADLTYQQGTRRMWSRRTRYDYYMPVFAHLGEQAILNKEIVTRAVPEEDNAVFGYQERWAEYRYRPSQISGLFKSQAVGTLDSWHLAQYFNGVPSLGDSFISEWPPMERVLAVGAQSLGHQFIFDSIFSASVTRPMPLYSVPGLVDHF